MSEGVATLQQLEALATRFADDLTDRVQRVVPTTERFRAVLTGEGKGAHVAVSILDPDSLAETRIPLTIGGEPRLDLRVKFQCCWDGPKTFLAVDKSFFHVRLLGEDAPLWRYEYVRRAKRSIPSAHLQIHAHRDEIAYLLMRADRGRPQRRYRKDKVPRLAEFHFPLGGHRFRPCLEDILQSLIDEFEVDSVNGWEGAVKEGRERYRRLQIRAAVRDAPEEAAEALRDMHYTVTPPADSPPENLDRLNSY